METITRHRWLRTQLMEPITMSNGDVIQYLRAIRDDGHLFEAQMSVGPECTPQALRAKLDTHVDDVPTFPAPRNFDPNCFRGHGKFIEEPGE